MKKNNASFLLFMLCLCMIFFLSSCGEPKGKKIITLEVAAMQPEYEAQEKAIWNIFEKENPNIKIELSSYNEDALPALFARIAGGDPLDIDARRYATKDNYKQWVNLSEIDFKFWDYFTFDAKNEWADAMSIPGYTPVISPFAGLIVSFIYDVEGMEAAGIDASNIRTWKELDVMLEKLKAYVDTNPDLNYVISTGNHGWCWPYMLANPIMTSLDADAQEKLYKVMTGEIKWTDLENNPWAMFFKWLKNYYDKGYLPNKFWEITWDEFEAGMVAKTSILTMHGPWMWEKLETADPEIKLSGFPFPANSEGKIQAFATGVRSAGSGAGIYVNSKRTKDEMDAVVQAFNWFHSPEIIKLRCEALNMIPAYDLSSVGGVDLKGTQYISIVKAIEDGKFGNISWDDRPFAIDLVDSWYKEGQPSIKRADDLLEIWGKYLSNNISLEELMDLYQKRFSAAYDMNKAN